MAQTGERALVGLLDRLAALPAGAGPALLDDVVATLGADRGRIWAADYSLRRLQQVDVHGPVGEPIAVSGTLAGRAFSSCQVVVTPNHPALVTVPLLDGAERIGVLELEYEHWGGEPPALLEPVVAVLVLALVTKNRYSDRWLRARRSKRLSVAAEVQWELLPPLSCTIAEVGVSGILEPAYDIGGDSFDYAVNNGQLDFAVVDAMGHGMSSVMMSATAINSLRNARRSEIGLADAYAETDRLLREQFGRSRFVTGQLGSLDLASGALTWINAGHVLPKLVRNGSLVGELACRPSWPLGLGGDVAEVATEHLQGGDRVLFYTDGITESRSPDGVTFGEDRLDDFLVRAALDEMPVAETARRLSESVTDYVDDELDDDATLLLIEYHGPRAAG